MIKYEKEQERIKENSRRHSETKKVKSSKDDSQVSVKSKIKSPVKELAEICAVKRTIRIKEAEPKKIHETTKNKREILKVNRTKPTQTLMEKMNGNFKNFHTELS